VHDGVELGLWCLTSLSTIFQLYGVSGMLEKYIITLEMLTKTFIVKIHSAYHTSKNIGIEIIFVF
jgi:hypothetical protein